MTLGPGRPHGSGDRSPPSAPEGAAMEIAVVGISGRWPGDAENPQKLWNMVSEARSARTEMPADRFNIDSYVHPNNERRGVANVRHAHLMGRDVSAFDAPFFSLPIPEVKAMDPQQRMALECTYEALENAGVRMEDIQGSDTSCYVGTFTSDYKEMVSQDFDDMPMYHAVGTGAAILSNRVSWFYDLKGPSMTVDTACSASLVALHLACQSLRTGESKMSIVGGTNLILMPDIMTGMTRLHFLSPDGKCHSFDHRANGYARGEGAAFCVLKPLHLAIQDGDVIRGVIRNTGVNQDGNTPGITLPSSESQEALIRKVYKEAGLSMADTAYVEAHGTGTPAGDPAEASALSATFGKAREHGKPVYMGSIKSNIGHLEGASGLTQLVKGILMIEKGQIPASINYEKPSPRIPMEEWNLAVPTKLMPWPVDGIRRVSINSFGYGGTNAHCIIDDAYHYMKDRNLVGNHNVQNLNLPSPDSGVAVDASVATPKLLVWTSNDQPGIARNSTAFSAYLADMLGRGHLDEKTQAQLLAKFARTLSSRRSVLPWKSFAVAASCQDASTQLEKPAAKPLRNANSKAIPKLGFVFTGQGAQWYAMGRELLIQPVFRASIEASSKYLTSIGASWSLMTELCRDEASSNLGVASLSQPVCTALQIAMLELFKHWGVTPSSVVGHSSGEIAAAYAKGAITRENAWAIAYHRGYLSACIRELAPELDGAMMATGIGSEAAEAYIARLSGEHKIAIACVNSPSNVTISGDSKAIDELEQMIKSDGHFARKLRVEIAYHSPHMKVIAEKYLRALDGIVPLPETDNGVKMFSSLTGGEIKNSALDASYWVANMVGQVKFLSAVQSMITYTDGKSKRRQKKASVEHLIELGPHSALQGPLRQILEHESIAAVSKDVTYQSVLLRGQDACQTALSVAGRLFQYGYAIDINAVNNEEQTNPSFLADLPPFRWNHELKYWTESHRGKAHRFRKHPRKDLFGAETYDHLPSEPRFRNILRMVEVPWVQDHKVQGSMLYPAAGMMIMAIEAACQKADKTREIEGYELRDVIIGKAIVVPEDEAGVELMLTIKPFRTGSQALTSVWQEFQLYSRNEIWELNCSGLIQVKYKPTANSLFADEDALLAQEYQTTFRQIQDNCTRTQHPAHFYDHLTTIGLHYGPVFQGVDEIKRGEYQSACKVKIPDTKSIMPNQVEFPHVIHPATLDSIIQMVLPSYSPIDEDLNSPVVPTSIRRLYVSADIPSEPGLLLPGYSTCDWSGGPGNGVAAVVVSNESWDKPLVIFEGFRATEVSLPASLGLDSTAAMRKLGSYTHWQEDLSLLDTKQVMELYSKAVNDAGDNDRKLQEELEIASFIFIKRVLKECSPEEAENFNWNFKLYYQYMQRCYELGKAGKLCYQKESKDIDWLNLSEDDESKILERVRVSSSNGAAIVQHGKYLPEILRGTVQPLQILMENNLLTNYYTTGFGFAQCNTRLAFYLDLVAHKNPALRILEIGGGTAGCTRPIMEALSGPGGADPRFSNYTFTDLSLGYFEKAKEKLAPWLPLMTFSKLDIEVDPSTQGFEEGTYDIIVASNVLHATRFMGNTLRNVRKLLKPDGQLVLAEITNPCGKMRTHMLVGSLEGWWYGEEDGRHFGPTLSLDGWDTTMKEAGFTGVDMSFEDFKDTQDVEMSVIISTASELPPPPTPKEVIIVLPQRPGIETLAFANRMTNLLKSHGSTDVSTLRLEDTLELDVANKSCLVLLDAEKAEGEGFLPEVSENDWGFLKRLIFLSADVTYITRGGAVGSQNPASNMMTGLARCIRSENPSLSVATIDIELDDALDTDETANAVLKAFKAICSTKEDERHEWEYAVRNGMPMVQRVMLEGGVNDVIATYNVAPKPEEAKFSQEGRPLKLAIGTPGQLDTLSFTDDKTVTGPLLDHDVEIQVKAAGLSTKDVMVALGQMNYQPLGMDCSGIVTRVGSGVTAYKAGDKVMTWKIGTFGNVTRSPESMVQRIPEHLDFAAAASIPLIYSTAHFALSDASRLRQGETVLIHGASRGVGQAAIVLAQHIGAEIFATVSSEAKKQLLIDNYGIAEDHIFSSRDSSFVKGVLRMTNGQGVDVILNSLSGEALRESWHCIARFGRFVELGQKDIAGNTGLDMAPFNKNVTFQAINLIDILGFNIRAASRIFGEVMDLLRQGIARPVAPITVLPFSRVEEAFRLIQTEDHVGKIVLEAHDDEIVPALPAGIPQVRFEANATYILAGGSGGIGRCIAEWMAKSGAKNILLLSRSGAKRDSVKSLVAQLTKQGVNVAAWECDVAEEQQLIHAVARCKHESWPPIRGVLQGAMVLRDGIYQSMSRDTFLEATRPKVQGSWNLHKHLPKDLDFFVLLSSLAGITGNRGQGNYSAANTFQDALARYRHSLGLKACSIDVGMILGVGFVAEVKGDRVLDNLKMWNFTGIREKEFLGILQAAVTGQSIGGRVVPPQLITGLATGGMMAQSGNKYPGWFTSEAKFSHILQIDTHQVLFEDVEESAPFQAQLLLATNADEASDIVCEALVKKLAKLMTVSTVDIEAGRPVSSYGVDSLLAVELRSWVYTEMKADVSVFDLLSNIAISTLAKKIVSLSKLVPESFFTATE